MQLLKKIKHTFRNFKDPLLKARLKIDQGKHRLALQYNLEQIVLMLGKNPDLLRQKRAQGIHESHKEYLMRAKICVTVGQKCFLY